MSFKNLIINFFKTIIKVAENLHYTIDKLFDLFSENDSIDQIRNLSIEKAKGLVEDSIKQGLLVVHNEQNGKCFVTNQYDSFLFEIIENSADVDSEKNQITVIGDYACSLFYFTATGRGDMVFESSSNSTRCVAPSVYHLITTLIKCSKYKYLVSLPKTETIELPLDSRSGYYRSSPKINDANRSINMMSVDQSVKIINKLIEMKNLELEPVDTGGSNIKQFHLTDLIIQFIQMYGCIWSKSHAWVVGFSRFTKHRSIENCIVIGSSEDGEYLIREGEDTVFWAAFDVVVGPIARSIFHLIVLEYDAFYGLEDLTE
jgi:hypothetical protein